MTPAATVLHNKSFQQTRETQLVQLYVVLGLRWVIARYDVLSTLHETGPWLLVPSCSKTSNCSSGHSQLSTVSEVAAKAPKAGVTSS